MNPHDMLLNLATMFATLSALSFGGVAAVLPELQRQMVQVHHWMSAQQFSALYALCQAAPGPNVLVFPLIGWRLAGLAGLVVCATTTFGPPALLTAFTLKIWNRYQDHPWRRGIQSGLAPVTAGLVAASAALISDSVAGSLPLAGIIAASAALAIGTRTHPLLILFVGAALGLLC